jgi:hypothetical protein
MLEYVVRPFVSPAPQSSTLIPSSPSTTTEKATLSWGAEIAVNLPSPQGLSVKTVCDKTNQNEITRNWEDVNIHSQDNPDNFITVRRTKSLGFHEINHDQCNDGWDQVSDVAHGTTAALNDIDTNFGGSTLPSVTQRQISVNLSNNTVAEPAPNPGGTGTTKTPDNTTDPVTGQPVGPIPDTTSA